MCTNSDASRQSCALSAYVVKVTGLRAEKEKKIAAVWEAQNAGSWQASSALGSEEVGIAFVLAHMFRLLSQVSGLQARSLTNNVEHSYT